MAPELLRGEPATARSDQYAFALVIYEIGAGQRAYEGSSMGHLVQRILAGSAVPLGQLRPNLPPELCAAVARAIATRAEDRFASVDEFVGRDPGLILKFTASVKVGSVPKNFPLNDNVNITMDS